MTVIPGIFRLQKQFSQGINIIKNLLRSKVYVPSNYVLVLEALNSDGIQNLHPDIQYLGSVFEEKVAENKISHYDLYVS
jgi:hypothetical protein